MYKRTFNRPLWGILGEFLGKTRRIQIINIRIKLMKYMNEKKEQNILNQTYKAIAKVKTSITQPLFFDYIVPPNIVCINDLKTKAKYIQNYEKMPIKVKEHYRDKNNEKNIKRYLRDWYTYIGSDFEKIINSIFTALEPNNAIFINWLKEKDPEINIFYEIFRYCLTEEYGTEYRTKSENTQFALKEFNEKILIEYGVSGKTAKNVILQLANIGTENPYILFEAGEIEFTRGSEDSDTDNLNCLEKAYEYYTKASKLGFVLADWSLGYLVYMCRKKTWHINAFKNMSRDEKAEMAINYFKKAAQNGCAKAFNSLGNIVLDDSIDSEMKRHLKSAKEYYYQAAIQNNYYGMYHYARMLEKDLKKQVDEKAYEDETVCEQMMKIGSEMLNFFKRAAALGYPKANYRCALYYGHLPDDQTAMNDKFHLIKQEKVIAIDYLEIAVKSNERPLCYDAYIYLSDYILNEQELFYGWKNELQRVKHFIEMLNEELINTQKASDRQKVHIINLKQSLDKKINNVL